MGAVNCTGEFTVSRSGCPRSPCCPRWLLEEAPHAFPTARRRIGPSEPPASRGRLAGRWEGEPPCADPSCCGRWCDEPSAVSSHPPSVLSFFYQARSLIPLVALQGRGGRGGSGCDREKPSPCSLTQWHSKRSVQPGHPGCLPKMQLPEPEPERREILEQGPGLRVCDTSSSRSR